jgi:hypothetical protein
MSPSISVVMLLNPSVPAKTVAEFITYAKADRKRTPRKRRGSSGCGRGARSGQLQQSRVAILSLALPELSRRQEQRVDPLIASPGDLAQPDDLTVGVEGDAENLGYRSERADIQADAGFRHVQDEALDPRRIGFADQEARPVIIDAFVVSAAKAMPMSRARRQAIPFWRRSAIFH